jgi:serine/threonine protein kinase
MGTVQKAVDLQSNQFAAIKRMKQHADQERSNASFNREVNALERLKHPNIVSMLTVDRDPSGRWFLAMEWIDDNLEDWILRYGAVGWNAFLRNIGHPLLSAIEYAQMSHDLVHRDLNPRNILVTGQGIPKITDYGISKVLDDRDAWLPRVGRTLIDARTPGFSPKEPDDRAYFRTRDCYSLAAISVFCLVGRRFESDADLTIGCQEANLPDSVRPLIEDTLSEDPGRRPIDARTLQIRLKQVEDARAREHATAFCCYLDLSEACIVRLQPVLELSSQEAIEDFVLEELADVCAIEMKRTPQGERAADALDIIGGSWRFRAVRSGRTSEKLEIVAAYELDPAKAGELRDQAYRPRLAFSFSESPDPDASAQSLVELVEDIQQHDNKRARERRAINSERIFRAWKSYLRDRLDLEAHRSAAIIFVSRRISNDTVTFTADITQTADILGQKRYVRVGGRHVFGTIARVILDQVTMRIDGGDPELLPRKGDLLLNTRAAESSLNYQGSALDAVMYGRTPNPRLREILLDPSCAGAPDRLDGSEIKRLGLSGEKLGVLTQALGTTEMLSIEGPPGTGKTDLISEIVIAWLARFPKHRILIASQTHSALDEAIERITKLRSEMGSAIIRIGRHDDPRIAPASQKLLLEQKVGGWAESVRKLAEANMTDWAAERGVNRQTVELGIKVERLVQLLWRRYETERLIDQESGGVEDAEQQLAERALSPDESEELEVTTTEISNRISLLKDTLRTLKRQEKEVRSQLSQCPDLGPDLARMTDISELEEWQDLCFVGDDNVRLCRERLALLENWYLRVGRSGDFNAAVMNSAHIIAATCIGIAGTKGVENVEFDLCIVDEASKATATEILVPLSRSHRWIIVGDPKQLPPFFEELGEDLIEKFDEKSEIRATVLDRMTAPEKGLPKACRAELKIQRRMIEPIGNLVSDCFYSGALQSPIKSHGLKLTPEIEAPITWYTTSKEHRRSERPVRNTFENLLEVEWARAVLDRLERAAHRQARRISVAVIAGYAAQVKRLSEMTERNASDWPSLQISCNTVDAFQGKQADVCIYSVTLSNRRGKLRFLKEKPRLNVALSRARSALILIGDHHFCRTAKGFNPFRPVIEWVESHPDSSHLGSLRS